MGEITLQNTIINIPEIQDLLNEYCGENNVKLSQEKFEEF